MRGLCPNCGHKVSYHVKSHGCTEGDRSWTCGCQSTRFSIADLTPKERVIYNLGKQAGKKSAKRAQ
jgi:hypothetical protein